MFCHQRRCKSWVLSEDNCPGFGQYRVNFHQKPGGDTARWADPNWPDKIGYSIPYATMLSFQWESWPVGSRSWLGSAQGTRWWEFLCAFCCLFCILSLSVLSLLLFSWFAVLLNCPYPNRRVFCLFHSIFLPTPVEGRAIERLRGPLLQATAKPRQQQRSQERKTMAITEHEETYLMWKTGWGCLWERQQAKGTAAHPFFPDLTVVSVRWHVKKLREVPLLYHFIYEWHFFLSSYQIPCLFFQAFLCLKWTHSEPDFP